MEQGTKEWLEWRRQGIGASESAALLQVCPYKTPFQLYQEKLGAQGGDDDQAELFRMGHEAEAELRAAYEFETGLDFPPALFEHPEFPFIRASLDGWCADATGDVPKGLECKLVGHDKFHSPIPEHHIVQVQHQMLVTATDSWAYLRKNKLTGERKVEIIQANKVVQSNILGACWQFWDQVQKRIPPAYTERDWVPDTSTALVRALAAMRDAKTTKERQKFRADVLGLVRHKRTVCHGVKISLEPDRITFPKEEGNAG